MSQVDKDDKQDDTMQQQQQQLFPTRERIPAKPFNFVFTEETYSPMDKKRKVIHSTAQSKESTFDTPADVLTLEKPFLDLSSLQNHLILQQEVRQKSNDLGFKLKITLLHLRKKNLFYAPSSSVLHEDHEELLTTLQTMVLDILQHRQSHSLVRDDTQPNTPHLTLGTELPPPSPQIYFRMHSSDIQIHFEDYVRYRAFSHFLHTGTLLAPSEFDHMVSDEEYLLAIMAFLGEDLVRYVLGRATLRDIPSVQLARDMADAVHDFLLTFDFPNGNLRRRYDGIKYVVKTCETVLYELCVTGRTGMDMPRDPTSDSQTSIGTDAQSVSFHHSMTKSSSDSNRLLPYDELVQLRKRVEQRDNQREVLIKHCRDAQKAAKQSIFALHRGDKIRAFRHIYDCEKIIQEILLPILQDVPTLRVGGCFSSLMEEYAEAKLFYSWFYGLHSDRMDNATVPMRYPMGCILHPTHFDPLFVRPEEYLGALCDLTGEIGRYAVQRGIARDSMGASFCLETNACILHSLVMLRYNPLGSSAGKKMDQVRRNVDKLERMIYELSLVNASGRSFTMSKNQHGEEEEYGKETIHE